MNQDTLYWHRPSIPLVYIGLAYAAVIFTGAQNLHSERVNTARQHNKYIANNKNTEQLQSGYIADSHQIAERRNLVSSTHGKYTASPQCDRPNANKKHGCRKMYARQLKVILPTGLPLGWKDVAYKKKCPYIPCRIFTVGQTV